MRTVQVDMCVCVWAKGRATQPGDDQGRSESAAGCHALKELYEGGVLCIDAVGKNSLLLRVRFAPNDGN